jgi:putative Mn2+ efflux pump MntP
MLIGWKKLFNSLNTNNIMAVFILCTIGLGLTLYYILYKQIYGGIVRSISGFLAHCFVFTIFYSMMISLGYAIARFLEPLLSFSSHWLSMALFFFIGLKMYRQVIKQKSLNWSFDTSQIKTLILFSLSNSFDGFFAGIALGFFMEFSWVYLLAFAAIMIVFQILAFVMARRKTATMAVWLFASLGTSLIGMNVIVVLLYWLFWM